MDPNATLARIREVRNEILNGNHDDAYMSSLADDLAELIQSLDEWLSNGGFRPTAWNFSPIRAYRSDDEKE